MLSSWTKNSASKCNCHYNLDCKKKLGKIMVKPQSFLCLSRILRIKTFGSLKQLGSIEVLGFTYSIKLKIFIKFWKSTLRLLALTTISAIKCTNVRFFYKSKWKRTKRQPRFNNSRHLTNSNLHNKINKRQKLNKINHYPK